MMPIFHVSFSVSGLSAEKLLNAARQAGIAFRKLERQENRRLFLVSGVRDYRVFSALAVEKGFSVSAPCPLGAYAVWIGIWKRKGLLAGLFLCMCLLLMAAGRIWSIRIENAGAYRGEIASYLEEMGIRPGIQRSEIDPEALEETMEWRFPMIKWVRPSFSGMTLVIGVEEGTPPPAIEDQGENTDVIAAEDGILIRLTVYAGTPVCRAGELVKKGQVLIRGVERNGTEDETAVRARGEAWARVWRSTAVRIPLMETVSTQTGGSAVGYAVRTPFFELPLTPVPDFLSWDEKRRETTLCGAWLPLTVQRIEYREAALEYRQRNQEEVKAEAAKAALEQIRKAEIVEDFIDKWVDYSMIDRDTIEAKATVEIARDIACYQIEN